MQNSNLQSSALNDSAIKDHALMVVASVDYAPTLRLLLLAALVALLPLAWVWLRQRGANSAARLAALTSLTAFLTFDLIVFGAFTRLSDSGLGCPDWPGCYGAVTPWGAQSAIDAAQSAMPTGPVTHTKAWIEMIHRYLAMTVGALILVLATFSWTQRRSLPLSPTLPLLTLVWVIVQGLFGKYTVTLKLYPAIVTLHLLGGLFLLALLVAQREAWRALRLSTAAQAFGVLPAQPLPQQSPLSPHKPHWWPWLLASLAALWLQIALGGWVSTNYAVLACNGFPQCNGAWWPSMDFAQGFSLLRDLGHTAQGELLSLDALAAIHMAHRLGAIVLVLVLCILAWRLWPAQSHGALPLALPLTTRRAYAWGLLGLLFWQLISGLSNVVLGWPLVAALAHSAGAAGLVALITSLALRQHWAQKRPALGLTPSAPLPSIASVQPSAPTVASLQTGPAAAGAVPLRAAGS